MPCRLPAMGTVRLMIAAAVVILVVSGTAARGEEPAEATVPVPALPSLPEAAAVAPPLDAEPVPPPPPPSIFTRWWFWTAAGALVVGTIVLGVALQPRDPSCPGQTLCL